MCLNVVACRTANAFTGEIPFAALAQLSQLREFSVSSNAGLSGPAFDSQLTAMSSLSAFDASHTAVSGELDGAVVAAMPALNTLLLDNTKISGSLPLTALAAAGGGQMVRMVMRNNALSGVVDGSALQALSLTTLQLSNNPALVAVSDGHLSAETTDL